MRRPSRYIRIILMIAVLSMPLTSSSVLSAIITSYVNGDIRLIEPSSTRVKVLHTITVEIADYAGPVIVLVDGVDVSSLVQHQGLRWIYHAIQPLSNGQHYVEVLAPGMASPTGARWMLSVEDHAEDAQKHTLYSKSGISLTGSQVFGDKVKNKEMSTSANLAVNVGMQSGGTEVSFESSFGYSNTSSNNQLTPSGLLLQLRHVKNLFALGDVNFKGTPLTASSLARRGILADLHWENTSLQLLQANSRTVTGWKSGLGSDNQIQGIALSHGFGNGQDQPLRIAAVALSGEILNASSGNVASTAAPSRGNVAGLQGSGRYAGMGYNAEVGISKFDADTQDNTSAKQDVAASVQLDRVVAGVSLMANYQRAGTDYASIADPGATYDREQLAFSGGAGLGSSSLSASLSRSHDNLDSDPSRPIVYNNNLGLTYAFTPASWPTLSVSYLAGQVKSESEPAGTPRTDIGNRSVTAALSYGRTGWSGNLVFSDAWIDDPLNGDSNTRNATLSVSMQSRDQLSITPVFSVTRSEQNAISQQTGLGTLTLNWRISASLSLSGQMVWIQNDASDDSVDNNQRNAVLRATWDITPSLKAIFPHQQTGLTLSYNGNRFVDNIDSSRNQSDQSVMLGIQVSAPLKGEYKF